jgi:hypothetical protein
VDGNDQDTCYWIVAKQNGPDNVCLCRVGGYFTVILFERIMYQRDLGVFSLIRRMDLAICH